MPNKELPPTLARRCRLAANKGLARMQRNTKSTGIFYLQCNFIDYSKTKYWNVMNEAAKKIALSIIAIGVWKIKSTFSVMT